MVSNSGKKLLEFDNDHIFLEKMKISKRNSKENYVGHYPTNDITFSNTQFTKTIFETDPFIESFDSGAHLQYQHINNYKPLSQLQRSTNKKMTNESLIESLDEIYN